MKRVQRDLGDDVADQYLAAQERAKKRARGPWSGWSDIKKSQVAEQLKSAGSYSALEVHCIPNVSPLSFSSHRCNSGTSVHR